MKRPFPSPPSVLLSGVAATATATGDGRPRTLNEVAGLLHYSAGHAQRLFTRMVGESPKQYQLRLRLDAAAVDLASTRRSVADVAVGAGFDSHDGFTRAFRRRYGVTPSRYRATHRVDDPGVLATHARVVTTVGPCIGLYHLTLDHLTTGPRPTTRPDRRDPMTHQIERRELTETPMLAVTRRTEHEHIAEVLAEALPAVFNHVMGAGLAMAGPPFVRYLQMGPAYLTLEAGIPLAEMAEAPAGGDIAPGTLPGGPAAVTVHIGPYDTLPEAHAALERWMVTNEMEAAGPPWEVYLTDPAEVPDPAQWRTEVIWPLAG